MGRRALKHVQNAIEQYFVVTRQIIHKLCDAFQVVLFHC